MNNIAIIPARRGSKRIPRKNIKDFFGKPVIAYSIEAALKSCLFSEVMVSTNCEGIAKVAEKFGAKVPFFRRDENSADESTTMDAISEVLDRYKNSLQKEFDFGCCIYPAAPLIVPEHLKDGYNLLLQGKYKSVFPVVEFSYPIWRGLRINKENLAELMWPEYSKTRSQDIEKVYHDAGQWYWFNTKEISDSLFTDKSGTIILPAKEVQDIDNTEDWEMAEMKYKILRSNDKS
jgi:pseudaminic acid cytidylyltransferase